MDLLAATSTASTIPGTTSPTPTASTLAAATGENPVDQVTRTVRALTWEAVGNGLLIILGTVIVAWIIKVLVQLFFIRVTGRTEDSAQALAELIRWIIIVFGIAAAITYVFPSVKPVNIVGGIGVVSLAAGIAFQTVLGNLFAGLVILVRQTPRVGDQISLEDVAGTITEIRLSYSKIRTFNGRQVLVPNGVLHESVLTVQTRHESVRTSFTVSIQNIADFARARTVAEQALAGLPEILNEPAPSAILKEIEDGYATMEVRFWSGSRQMDTVHALDAAVVAVSQGLDDAGISIGPSNVVALDQAQATQSRNTPPSP